MTKKQELIEYVIGNEFITKPCLQDKFTTLLDEAITEQLILHDVSVSLPTDPLILAEYLHDSYEIIAKKSKWNTQEICKVSFKDLPNENKTTMILLAGKLILDFVVNER